MNKEEPEFHFLLEESETAKWRRLALFFLAIILESIFAVFLGISSHWIERYEQRLALAEAARMRRQQTTFLVMPPDLQNVLRTPKTNILSNKNRLAHGPSPIIKKNGLAMPYVRGNTHLPKLAGGAKPKLAAPKQMAQAKPPAATKPKPPTPQAKPKILLSDVTPPSKPNPSLEQQLGITTPGEAIQQSLKGAAQGRSTGRIPGPGESPDQMNNLNPNFSTSGPIILSNTRGVDFGPYLAEILEIVRENWYAVIPESARLGEQGRVALIFAIEKNGSVAHLELVSTSGKPPLDLAAMSSIKSSDPFPPLPSAFTGQRLRLQFNYFYNERP
jgi:TonB family protein